MLSVGLCLSARLPAGLLVFFGFVGSFGSIDHRLQQFVLLPCGAVQTVDFFDHIVGVGGCDPFSEFVPSLFRFGVMYHHFNGGTLSHGSLTSDYIAITSFLRVTGCPLFAAVSAQNIQSQTDQQSHINAEHFSLAGIAHKAFDAGFIDREDLLQKNHRRFFKGRVGIHQHMGGLVFLLFRPGGNSCNDQCTTTLLQRHAGEGETIAEAIRDCLDYGKDPEKTESGKYISAYECDPATVADEFLLAKASYAAMTGREQKKENNVLCYQIRQSFYPGEITPKEANRIGYELAMRWTKGRHAFIVTTHTDKQHIHCHIYYNSTTLDCTRKFRNFWGSSFALRRLSDRLCLENGLSIVENPKPRSKSKYRNYGEWQKDRKGPLSYQDRLRLAIDTALAERPADLDEFLNLMKRAGYEVKTVRGGGISFRLTEQGQERFTRLRASTLGDGYDLQDVLSAIEGKEKRPGRSERKISLAVDIQAKLAAGKGPGYERWAKVFNIKQMAAALAYIQDNNLTDYEQLAKKATEAADRFHVISEQVKQTEQAMKTNAGLKAATVQYAKTRPVFEQYKATKYSRKFLAEHEADLELYRAAQAEMRSLLGGAKLPKMDVLKEEGRKLIAKKKQLYGEYQKARRDMQELVTIKANIDTLMGYTEPGRKQEKER